MSLLTRIGASVGKWSEAHPLLALAGTFASIVGLVWGIVATLWLIPGPDLVYSVHPTRTVVVKSDTASRLQVSYDGKEIKGDVSAVQITIANWGKQAVEGKDILRLEPLQLVLKNEARILEKRIIHESRKGIGLRLDDSDALKGRIRVNFEIFDVNDRAVFQVVYVGAPELGVEMEGSVKGQKSIRRVSREHNSIIGPVGLLIAVGLMIYALGWRREAKRPVSGFVLTAILVVGCVVAYSKLRPSYQDLILVTESTDKEK